MERNRLATCVVLLAALVALYCINFFLPQQPIVPGVCQPLLGQRKIASLPLNSLKDTSTSVDQIAFTRFVPENGYVSYIVQPHDTLTSISKQFYNSPKYWTDLWDGNRFLKSPTGLQTGKMIVVQEPVPNAPDPLLPGLKQRYTQLTQAEQNQDAYVQPVLSEAEVLASYPQSSFDWVYKAAGARFGVPWQILYGIHMTETGGRNGPIMSHYGTGAQGPMQFMPGTFQAYAVSARGNGVPNINDAEDAIYTAANFLAKHGSIMAGLEAYGGNISGVIALAEARGYTP